MFWIHTERIRRLPAWFERIFNTPSHHRVHHGMNHRYLDRNYGGILIVWDRFFGTWEPESERVRYGLTEQLRTSNLIHVALHEYVALWRDLRAARGWRTRRRCCCAGPLVAARVTAVSSRASDAGRAPG